MKKIFIDTNIFLDFYRSNKESLKVFDELKKYSRYIVFPLQVYEEYKRNRVGELEEILSKVKQTSKISPYSTSIVSDLEEFKNLMIARNEYNNCSDKLMTKIQQMIQDPNNDFIFNKINEITGSKDVTLINVNDIDIEKAKVRQLLGNPPGSNKFCIGDEVIWECILSNVKDDLVIVSRDLTYKNNSYILKEEFATKTGKTILGITDTITSALKIIGENPNEDIIKIEEEQVKKDNNHDLWIESVIPSGWEEVDRKAYSTTVRRGQSVGYTGRDISYMCHYCGNYGPWNGVICLSCGHRSEPD